MPFITDVILGLMGIYSRRICNKAYSLFLPDIQKCDVKHPQQGE
ncbi:hypothetical Protein YC6258_05607 [Gynuella sunshinyii YC6258]|uniref:Uncharacterized protein n=1 Tax=Gynuella sunshinyii YC6258 TaxID=1445510 RepID=A0A0C5VEB1_9GAMM|nr:hypothetical Protein YC6258_05607 [Gynuella sunshinyii YC6258]